jgi:DNA polymerase III delta prime subunit
MQSAIILGTIEKTKEKALEIINENNISKFDVSTFTFEKSVGIADIKLLQKNIFLKPLKSEKKLIVLEMFLGASTDAQNAFLKILEEPPASTIILILVNTLDFVLPTILSRCNLLDLSQKKKLENSENYKKILDNLLSQKENPLILAQNYGKDKQIALEFLENLIIVTEENLINNNSLGKILKNLQKSYSLIKSTNVNVRFTLENLFLNFK